MTSDYDAIRADNERRYGTDIGRIGPMLLANRYADRTHFIFELLQNAEDALARRRDHQGARAVNFVLAENELRVSHFGEPFDERDVRGICGIAESTKDLTNIGCFGIGFKSVYAFTDRPVIHSGDEDFTIEHFVWPTAAPPVDRKDDETLIVLPLKSQDGDACQEITAGLGRLGPDTLLFLRQIEGIEWKVEDGPSGLYLRGKSEAMGENIRRITVIGQEEGRSDIEETWFVFSREARTEAGNVAGYVEIAFLVANEGEPARRRVCPVTDPPLVVFFPTVVSTHLGFLVQGPYRTTPSRDNVPRDDAWNQHLVQETAGLLAEAMRKLRDMDLLNAEALRVLPLDRSRFEGKMFAPLFETVRHVLRTEPLLPRFGGGYVAAAHAKLARAQELRELFNTSQLATLFGQKGELAWLSGDITQDLAPELRQYLMQELDVAAVTPDMILPMLNIAFLEAQSDEWIVRLYEFLKDRPGLRHLEDVPLVRLANGTHVKPKNANGQPLAFLPGEAETGFPTVRASVCGTDGGREFLKSLGLREPDPVDDVVVHVLPKYQADQISFGDNEYTADIRRILAAYRTDSTSQRYKLIGALRDKQFVKAIDAGDGAKKMMAKPGSVYIATERLKEMFQGLGDVLLVDNSYECLRGEQVRELLEACGATRYLRSISVQPSFVEQELQDMRRKAGCEDCTYDVSIEDVTLLGLEGLLSLISATGEAIAARKAALLWEALADVQERSARAFSGTYTWMYYQTRSYQFDAAFVRKLNAAAWVPGPDGTLQRPGSVLFEETGWEANPFLLSKIRFKPPLIEALAREAGIEPGVLDLLKKHGLTSVAELTARLDIKGEPEQPGGETGPTTDEDALKKLLGDVPAPTQPVLGPAGVEPSGSGGGRGGSGRGTGTGAGSGNGKDAGERAEGAGAGSAKRTSGGAGGRPFISYVAAQPDEEDRDPDGLDYPARMALEAQAINLILAHEPKWQRTPTHNPGYDLFEAGDDGQPIRWVEVKAMTGGLHDRPVGLSRTQFECAREHREAYWLYVVEHAGTDGAHIVRIQNPAGKARTFTFDRGWLAVAQPDAPAGPAEPPDPEEPT